MSEPDPTPLSTEPKAITLYALGSNGNFQLGLSHNEDISHPQKCIFAGIRPSISTDTFATTSSTKDSPLSPPSPNTTQTHIPLNPGESISTLTAGGNHTLLLTSHGRVFAAGSNEHGQLALLPPSMPLSPSTITTTTAPPDPGFHHLTWTGPTAHKTPITHAACTFTATILVASHTTVYTVGHGPKGELGLGSKVTSTTTPTQAFDIRDVESPNARIKTIAACMDHILILSSSGTVYGCGASRKGQLGEALTLVGTCWVITQTDMHVNLPFQPSQVVSGREFSVLAGQRGGEVAIFGRGVNGLKDSNVAHGTSKHEPTNHSEKDSAITIHAGWSSTTTHHHPSGHLTGHLYTPPSPRKTHDRGQLPPATLPRVLHLAVGSEHSIALLEDGSVVAWGWGEHGNCGSSVDERGVVGGAGWNILSRSVHEGLEREGDGGRGRRRGGGGGVSGVGAGCGSSFFWVEEAAAEAEVED